MTHLSPAGAAMARPPARPLPHPFSGHMLLTLQIASRQARLATLEAEINAACERAAMGARSGTSAAREREHWNRAAWHRYLAAAMRRETAHGPRLRRLRQEISQLERLRTWLDSIGSAAAGGS